MSAERDFDLVVIGLGYVGLPLVLQAAKRGLRVGGYDVSRRAVDSLNQGTSYIDDVSDQDVDFLVSNGFEATTEPSIIGRARSVVICVPTPLSADGSPDLSAVLGAAKAAVSHMAKDTLLVLESTTSPGTTDEILRPMVEDAGFTIGQDAYLVFSPERIDPGNRNYTLENTPKVLGGTTDACRRRGIELYEGIVSEVVALRGTREAELCKLLENTYRQVNIALVNELAKYCHELNIDIWDVISGARTKPFGFQAFYPGPGIGGHCIPIDPSYLSYTVNAKLGYPFRIVELAQEINNSMPSYVVLRIQERLNDLKLPLNGSRVALLGITYKEDISDQRESPSSEVALRLISSGASVTFDDPFHGEWTLGPDARVPKLPLNQIDSSNTDLVVILQHHSSFDLSALPTGLSVLDTRGKLATTPDIETL